MKISRNWLQNYFDDALPGVEDISDALMFHVFEIDGVERVGTDGSAWEGTGEPHDYVLDVKVTPNRGHDCLAHRGIAKELSAIWGKPLKNDPFALQVDISKKSSAVTVAIADPKLCRRYIAGYIKNVKVGPSPEWLRNSLEAIGQRSINNVVDATNLVMFNVGQPLHAFDATRLGSLSIGVRAAHVGEQMEALDKKVYTLNPSLLVITADDRAVGIAGIKGGEADRIDESTTDVLIEAATFDGVTIRRGSQALKLRTDASARFEQVLSPYLAEVGMKQVVSLIAAIAGGEVEGFVDQYPDPHTQTYVAVTVEHINRLLGSNLTAADVAGVLARLGFAYKEEAGVFEVQPPQERLDITIAEDVVEEVGRIVGYDAIAAVPLPAPDKAPEINKNYYASEKAREEWTAKGYSEVFTSVFSDTGERMVLNKVDGVRPYLRSSLTPGLQDALAKNKPNKDLLGLKEIKLFEIGMVWKDGKEQLMIGTVSEKEAATEMMLVGPEAPAAYDDLPLSQADKYRPYSKYPYIVRDVAIWTPEGTDAAAVAALIKTEAGSLCQSVRLFDTFTKEGRTSLALRLIFQSFEKTLTEQEANDAMAKVSEVLKSKGFEIR